MEKQFIDIVYDLARTKYNKKAFTFEQIWNDFVKKAKLDAEEQKQAGEVYAAMLQDPRFIFAGKSQWKLRENLTLDEQSQLSNALYDFNTVAEEEGDEAEAAKKNRKSQEEDDEVYYEEDIRDEMYDEARNQALEDDEDESDEEDNESESEDEEEPEENEEEEK